LVGANGPTRQLLAQAAHERGDSIEFALTGDDALLRCELADFALLVCEEHLHDMSALDLVEDIARAGAALPLVILSDDGAADRAVEAMRLGARDFVRRPSDLSEARSLLARTLAAAAAHAPNAVHAPHAADPFGGIVGESQAMRDLLRLVATVAETDSTVLVTGETGTGKDLVGRALHLASRRRDRVFSAVNAAAIPENLLESELFGHRRGSFTGAVANKKGLFEQAHRGTVFLDEIAEMPLMMQAKLLRFLQTGEIQPVGAESTRYVDVRLVAATNKDLEREVELGRFREDLYYRLAVIPVHIPPLRERREDIVRLTDFFLEKYARSSGKPVRGVSAEARRLLERHDWPGNVRELENAIERGVALCRGPEITSADLTFGSRSARSSTSLEPRIASLECVERNHILHTLEHVGWNRKRAAEILEISTTTLWRRLKEFGVEGPAVDGRRA